MFNDVHLAKVSKINKTMDWSSCAPRKHQQSHTPGSSQRVNSKQHDCYATVTTSPDAGTDIEQAMRKLSEHGFIFGSTSPRAAMHDVDFSASVPQLHNTGELVVDGMQKENNESDNNISSCSTLDIVNKVENLSLLDLQSQLKSLTQRLHSTENQRDELQHKLAACTEEKELCYRRLEVISDAHENRITEMHCVIAELSKKLRTKQETTILEENEPEGSEISYQEESVYNSELNLTNPEVECQTDQLDANYLVGGGCGAENIELDENVSLNADKELYNYNETVAKSKVEALQEEVLYLKSQIALLQSEIADNTQNVEPAHMGFVVEGQQNVQFYAGDQEDDAALDDKHAISKDLPHNSGDSWNVGKFQSGDDVLHSNKAKEATVATINQCTSLTSPQAATVTPKMAERIKLRNSKELSHDISPKQLLNSALPNAGIVEHLVSDFFQTSNMLDSFMQPSDVHTEFQRLHSKIDQLKMQNVMLSLTLSECKEHCDQLYLLCGKYESNAIALQSAVNCSDRAIEAYDVMLALLESKIALMKEKTEAAEESRKAVEAVARHLLARLDSEKNLCENSLGPWKNTFSFNDTTFIPWTAEDDNRLRYHVSKLKGRRSTVQNTIVNLESPFSACYEKSRLALEECKEFSSEKDAQMDLETAILMQELLNFREENTQLKTKADEAERERQFAVDKINNLQEELQQLQMQLSVESEALFNLGSARDERLSYTDTDHAALTERQLVEALTRESVLKGRIQSLISTVSITRKSSNDKYEEVQNSVKDLQKTNIDLTQSLEYNKRKYQSRIRKLEQKLLDMNTELMHHRNMQKPHLEPQRALRKSKANVQSSENVPETIL